MTKTNYEDPGLTLANVDDALATAVYGAADYANASAAQKLRIDQAITTAALACETWDGNVWWWQRDTAYFQTNTAAIVTTADSGVSYHYRQPRPDCRPAL